MGLAKHPRVLQVVQAVLGDDVILLDSRFICKYPALKANIPSKHADDSIVTCEEEEVKEDMAIQESGLPYVAWHQDMR